MSPSFFQLLLASPCRVVNGFGASPGIITHKCPENQLYIVAGSKLPIKRICDLKRFSVEKEVTNPPFFSVFEIEEEAKPIPGIAAKDNAVEVFKKERLLIFFYLFSNY